MATKLILSHFTDKGIPKTGLSPEITIIDADTNINAISSQVMTELKLGFYKYSFTSYDFYKSYAIYIDGGDTLSNGERYQTSVNDSFVEDINNRPIEIMTKVLGLVQSNFRIKDQTYTTIGGASLLESATIKIYNDAADTNNDVNPISSYKIDAVYDGQGRNTDYKVVEL